MQGPGFFSRSSARLSPDRICRTRGDTLPAFSARATSSILPVRLKAREPRNVCGHCERGHPIRDRDIRAVMGHPRSPRSTAYSSLADERDLQVRRPVLFLVEPTPVDVACAPEQHAAVEVHEVVFHEVAPLGQAERREGLAEYLLRYVDLPLRVSR